MGPLNTSAVKVDEQQVITVDTDDRAREYKKAVRHQLELIGEEPLRPGLQKTPDRVAQAMLWLTRGYELNVRDVVGDALFDEEHQGMVMVRDIELYSMCEHHMLPF